MTDHLEIVMDPLPPDGLARLINEGVDLHNVAITGVAEWYAANFFLRSRDGEWMGGLLGGIWGGWLHVRSLWVASAARGKGHGGRLLDAAEAFAITRGCGASTLETHNPLALRFYERRGYVEFGRLTDYPPGHVKVYLRKTLPPAPPPSVGR